MLLRNMLLETSERKTEIKAKPHNCTNFILYSDGKRNGWAGRQPYLIV